ncbi:hypothetical protein [Actinokineospora sp. NBRC 105648]|uniref:hypothetical protein n=1 Tax=Actinokineospora sp. NBRC 105648 TaxID=3032206 RepID=UPI00249FA307|nr:hypothetical protein [Actinokineospora sp. NBRC 105648]GLZ42233.1 hypothetical protein Acsp05_58570 [Actinokineospora sp. NBRC 105648]
MITVSPAYADVPPAGKQFRITLSWNGESERLCVGSLPVPSSKVRKFPALPCDGSTAQLWKRSDNGRCIQNVAHPRSIALFDILQRLCQRGVKGPMQWTQDAQGRVTHKGTYLDYWGVSEEYGHRYLVVYRASGSTATDAGLFTFEEV